MIWISRSTITFWWLRWWMGYQICSLFTIWLGNWTMEAGLL